MAKKLAKKKSVSAASGTRKKAKVAASGKKIAAVSKSFTKTDLLNYLCENTELPKKKIAEVMEWLQVVMHSHVKSGKPFALPGILKITVVKKPATKQRKGVNPFTGEPTVFKAKPARKVVKIKPLKKLKVIL
ncbi:HU family DNA-binding protein [Rickettsiella massiliensis]|uniref:HU family DNA-binding protein n=1 Tax=Rickettsiella massiliensis TaxID=676517 RepID=UPI00029A2623|nr:HU family DNA-binding protein [Rickettsiella massiliensis]